MDRKDVKKVDFTDQGAARPLDSAAGLTPQRVRKEKKEPTVLITIKVTDEMRTELKIEAARHKTTTTQILTSAIEHYLVNHREGNPN